MSARTAIRRGAGSLGQLHRAPAAVLWAERMLRRARAQLPSRGLKTEIDPPPFASDGLTVAVAGWLRLRRATCLERSLIVQQWLLALGRPHDVLIGVAGGRAPAVAHAWLEGEDGRGYAVIAQVPALPPAP